MIGSPGARRTPTRSDERDLWEWMPRPVSSQTAIALGTRSHPEIRGATFSVQESEQPQFFCTDEVRCGLSPIRGFRPPARARVDQHGRMPSTTRARTSATSAHRHAFARSILIALLALLLAAPAPDAEGAVQGAALPDTAGTWRWPVDGAREVVEPFLAPAHEYGAGHRGMDVLAPIGSVVHAPADGFVAFRGVVVDRPLLTIDHGDGVVSTFEPMDSELTAGAAVRAGDPIGTVATGGHAPAGTLHVGVRLNGVYINPMLMFGDVPRAVLLPCCDAVTRGGARVGRSL